MVARLSCSNMTGVALKMEYGALEKLGHQDKAEAFVRVQVQERGTRLFAQSLQLMYIHRKLYCVYVSYAVNLCTNAYRKL